MLIDWRNQAKCRMNLYPSTKKAIRAMLAKIIGVKGSPLESKI
jgi:hypothetical protein